MAATRDLFDEDHEAFRDSVRKFVTAAVVPHLDEWRTAGRVPQDVFLTAGAEGMLGTAVPEDLGGGGTGDPRFTAVLVEEVAAVGATGLALTLAVHCGVCLPLLLDHGTVDQQRKWVPGLASGEHIGVTAATGAPVSMTGGGAFVLDVTVEGISGGVYPGLVALAAERDGQEHILLVSSVEESVSSDLVVDSLAARDAGQADLTFEGAVAEEWIIADATDNVRRDLDLWTAVLGVAAARRALCLTRDYVRERRVFGRPLSELENTRHRLAILGSSLATAQLFVDESVRQRLDGRLTRADAATARLAAQAIHDEATDQGMQLHGGYGYMREYPISHAFADARYLRMAGRASSDALESVAAGLGI